MLNDKSLNVIIIDVLVCCTWITFQAWEQQQIDSSSKLAAHCWWQFLIFVNASERYSVYYLNNMTFVFIVYFCYLGFLHYQ